MKCGNCGTEFYITSKLEDALQWRAENRNTPPYPTDAQFWCPVCNCLNWKDGVERNLDADKDVFIAGMVFGKKNGFSGNTPEQCWERYKKILASEEAQK